MNATIRASCALIDRFFPKGVLNRNDKTAMKTEKPIKTRWGSVRISVETIPLRIVLATWEPINWKLKM
jgi:hypothetical protein